MKETLKNFGKHMLWGLLIILGGLFIYLAFTITIGYIPYSDRPGPGWHKEEVGISLQEISFIWGFIWFLGIYILGELIIVYWLFRLFRLLGFNKIVYSILGGLIIGFFTLYLTLGIGWYIAIDGSTVIIGGVLGLIYGATLFPKFVRPQNKLT